VTAAAAAAGGAGAGEAVVMRRGRHLGRLRCAEVEV